MFTTFLIQSMEDLSFGSLKLIIINLYFIKATAIIEMNIFERYKA